LEPTEVKPHGDLTDRRPFAWLAFGGILTAAFCLMGALTVLAAEAWLPRPGSTRYIVNACLTVSAQGPAQIGLGWRAPRRISAVAQRPFRAIRAHHNALCGALPWATFLPPEGVIVVPMGVGRPGSWTRAHVPNG
jgi:hypothetical protein